MQKETIFYKKNFLIYGFGKSGYASYKFLTKKNNCKIIDDNNIERIAYLDNQFILEFVLKDGTKIPSDLNDFIKTFHKLD